MGRLRRLVRRVLSTVRAILAIIVDSGIRLPRSVAASGWRLALGSHRTHRTRISTLAMFVSTVVIAIGIWAVLVAGLETRSDSSFLTGVLIQIATSLWTYAAVAAVAVVLLRQTRHWIASWVAARRTGYSQRTIRRLAAEATSPDGSTTIVVGPGDSVLEIANRVLDAIGSGPIDASHPEIRAVDRLVDRDDAATVVEDESDEADAVTESDRGVVADFLVGLVSLLPLVGDRGSADDEHPLDSPEPGGLLESVRLSRLELASSLSFTQLLWRFVVPGVAAMVPLILVGGIWLSPWLYGVVLAVGCLAGGSYYQYSGWRRRRRLRALRTPTSAPSWDDIAILVKRVETEDTTAHIGWVAGRCYADYDADRLAATLAWVAICHVRGEEIPPTIQQAFARNIRGYVPSLDGYEENIERSEIMDTLADAVALEQNNILPKARLGDLVVYRDHDRIGRIGYDPRLVAECYQDLVPVGLVEEDVEVSIDDGSATMTAVRLRTTSIPLVKQQTEASFSVRFNPDYEPAYPLPEVDQTLDGVEDLDVGGTV